MLLRDHRSPNNNRLPDKRIAFALSIAHPRGLRASRDAGASAISMIRSVISPHAPSSRPAHPAAGNARPAARFTLLRTIAPDPAKCDLAAASLPAARRGYNSPLGLPARFLPLLRRCFFCCSCIIIATSGGIS